MELIVKIEMQYGQERIFPVNRTAQIYARLLERKTFTRKQIDLIKELGLIVKTAEEEL